MGGDLLKGVRKAYASKGDDSTLTRFVKIPGAEKIASKRAQPWLHGTRFEASVKGETIFKKSVIPPGDYPLVSGHNNVKIGRDVRKGKLFRGYWIFTLTLEERKTCPRTCFHWDTCYGNNMPFAKRIDHIDAEKLQDSLEWQIGQELDHRVSKKNGQTGILIRLHALGDFFSVDYVRFWERMLEKHDRLACFGYTAWKLDTEIGCEIARVKHRFGRRFAIRYSDGWGPVDCTVPIHKESDCPPNAFVCPEQTEKTRCCATCGLCWNTDKNVAFLEH